MEKSNIDQIDHYQAYKSFSMIKKNVFKLKKKMF